MGVKDALDADRRLPRDRTYKTGFGRDYCSQRRGRGNTAHTTGRPPAITSSPPRVLAVARHHGQAVTPQFPERYDRRVGRLFPGFARVVPKSSRFPCPEEHCPVDLCYSAAAFRGESVRSSNLMGSGTLLDEREGLVCLARSVHDYRTACGRLHHRAAHRRSAASGRQGARQGQNEHF